MTAFCLYITIFNFSTLSSESSRFNSLISVIWSAVAFSFTPSFLHSLCINFSWRSVSFDIISIRKITCELI